MIVGNYGGGTNSTALLVEAHRRGLRPDLVVMADTGSERPRTYAYLDVLRSWLASVDFPPLTVVKWIRVKGELAGRFIALHEWCEDHDQVPSRAFGLSGCTNKWKQQPIDNFLRMNEDCIATWGGGRPVERWIGYDADEPERADRMFRKNPEPDLWTWRAPLVEWGMGREECIDVIRSAGLPLPGKSACWMCPSSKPAEILKLGREHPELLGRALDMECAAIAAGNLAAPGTGEVKGMGGRLNWNALVAGDAAQTRLFPEVACGCYDGE